MGYQDDLNLYLYVHNDATNHEDPSGNCGPMCLGAVVGGGIELAVQLTNPSVRASYGRAGEALARGDVGAALHEAGGNIARIGISAAAGAVGQFGTTQLTTRVAVEALNVGGKAANAEAVVRYGRVAAATVSNAFAQGAAQGARNEFLGDHGSVAAATIGGGVGGAAGGVLNQAAEPIIAQATPRAGAFARQLATSATSRAVRDNFSCTAGSSGCPNK